MHPPPMPEVPTVTVDEAAALDADGARIIDVREPVEYHAAHVPGSDLLPMSAIQSWYSDLDKDDHLLVICRTGNRSAAVVNALIEQAGFTNAWNVQGGLVAWAKAGLPVEP